MKVEGITWHAVVFPPDNFAAQRDFAINTLGLTIFMEMDQMIALSMPNGSMYEIYTPATVPPYATTATSPTAGVSMMSKRHPRKLHPLATSCSARSTASLT